MRAAGEPAGQWPAAAGAGAALALDRPQVRVEVDLDRVPLRGARSAFAMRASSRSITRRIVARDGSVALPSSTSATHSDCASAIGMIAPSGWSSPMK